jgi:hypothetical protein
MTAATRSHSGPSWRKRRNFHFKFRGQMCASSLPDQSWWQACPPASLLTRGTPGAKGIPPGSSSGRQMNAWHSRDKVLPLLRHHGKRTPAGGPECSGIRGHRPVSGPAAGSHSGRVLGRLPGRRLAGLITWAREPGCAPGGRDCRSPPRTGPLWLRSPVAQARESPGHAGNACPCRPPWPAGS